MHVNLTSATAVNGDVDETIKNLFAYQPWTKDQEERGVKVRESLEAAFRVILENVPSCPTRTRAMNMLTDCRMLANAAITHNGKF